MIMNLYNKFPLLLQLTIIIITIPLMLALSMVTAAYVSELLLVLMFGGLAGSMSTAVNERQPCAVSF